MQSEPVSGQFRVFLSSPSGLDPDRAIVVDEINLLSESALSSGKPGLSIIRWPDDIAAAVAGYGQSVINSQTSNSNIFVCLIGARMGTPTPRANSYQ